MKTLTLDLGTQTGWTLSGGGETLASGTYALASEKELQQQRKEGRERTLDIRFSRLSAFVAHQIQSGVARIVFEDVQFTKSQAQGQLWASLRCAIWAAAQHSAIQICCVQVGTLKRFATGTGRSQKADMARALANAEPDRYRLGEDLGVLRMDGSLVDDDQVDAIWLARFTAAVDRGEQGFLSGFERKSARKVQRREKMAAARAKRRARKQAATESRRANASRTSGQRRAQPGGQRSSR